MKIELISEPMKSDDDIKITVASGSISKVVGRGSVDVSRLILNSILHVPKLNYNLVSIRKLSRD